MFGHLRRCVDELCEVVEFWMAGLGVGELKQCKTPKVKKTRILAIKARNRGLVLKPYKALAHCYGFMVFDFWKHFSLPLGLLHALCLKSPDCLLLPYCINILSCQY